MIDINKIENYSFFEKYGIGVIIYELIKRGDYNDLEDLLENGTDQDLVDYYNDVYRTDMMYKFRIEPSFDYINKKITYDYVGKKILSNSDYVMKSGNAKMGIYLSPHILSSDSNDCKTLFSYLSTEITKGGKNSGAISPFATKVVNKHKQTYCTSYEILQLIGQIVTTASDLKFYYIKDWENTSFIPNFEKIKDYLQLIRHIDTKVNVKSYLKKDNGKVVVDKKGVKGFNNIIPDIFNGNFKNSLTPAFGNDLKFIDLYIEVYTNIPKLSKIKSTWYEINNKKSKIITYDQNILDISIKYSKDFSTFTRQLLGNKISYKDNKDNNNSYYKKIKALYTHFNFDNFYKLLNIKGYGEINIKENNMIVQKLLTNIITNKMDLETKEKVRDLIKALNGKIYRMSLEKADKSGNKSNKDMVRKYQSDFKKTVMNYIEDSSKFDEFVAKVAKYFSKYNVGSIYNNEVIEHLMFSHISYDYKTFKEVAITLLYTNFYSDANTDTENETVTDSPEVELNELI